MKHVLYTTTLLLLLLACEQNEPMDFAGKGDVYFFEQTRNTAGYMQQVHEKNFSFAVLPDDVTRAEERVSVQLLGNTADRDRRFIARVVPDSSTAVEGTHYRLVDGVLPAGATATYLPVNLLRAPDLKNAAVKLYLEIVPSADLGVGVDRGVFFTLHVADMLMKPSWWDMYIDYQYFGTYCDNKYKFIIETLGIHDFPATSGRYAPQEGYYTPPRMHGFRYAVKTAYEEYRRTNPPIWVDDNADPLVEITFP